MVFYYMRIKNFTNSLVKITCIKSNDIKSVTNIEGGDIFVK